MVREQRSGRGRNGVAGGEGDGRSMRRGENTRLGSA